MKLTQSTVAKLEYSGSNNAAEIHFDDDLKGFGVRVYPSGLKSFVISYRSANRKKQYVVGRFNPFTVKMARDDAQALLADIARGRDPAVERQEKRRELTFGQLADLYLEHARHHKRSIKDDRQRLRDHILPKLQHSKLTEISPRQIERVHTKAKERTSPATANRCAALVKRVLNIAVEWGYLEKSPARNVKLFKEPEPRDIVLSPEQCAALVRACDDESNVHAAALFKLALYTGRRVGELQKLKWSDIDLERSMIVLHETKTGERQTVPINLLAQSVLESIPRLANNPHVIAGKIPGKPLNAYRKPWDRILKRACLEPFPPHGLRHNFASSLIAGNVPIEQVGHLLGHKSSLTTRKYTHHRPSQLRDATETLGNVIKISDRKNVKAAEA